MTKVDLFTKKSKGSKVLREVFTKTAEMDYKIGIWEGKIKTKLCKGEVLNAYRGLQNIYFPKNLLDMKLRLLLGKTQFNDRLCHWANTGESNRCYVPGQRRLCDWHTVPHVVWMYRCKVY